MSEFKRNVWKWKDYNCNWSEGICKGVGKRRRVNEKSLKLENTWQVLEKNIILWLVTQESCLMSWWSLVEPLGQLSIIIERKSTSHSNTCAWVLSVLLELCRNDLPHVLMNWDSALTVWDSAFRTRFIVFRMCFKTFGCFKANMGSCMDELPHNVIPMFSPLAQSRIIQNQPCE